MVYARFSSGYRGGAGGSSGPNDRCVLFNYPCQYEADETRNYELGMKGNALNGVFSFDASLYYIDWQDIQIQALHPQAGATYNTNGSSARSQGAEFSMQSTPFDGTTIAAWGAWNDAELTEPFPPGPLFGADGDRLPLSSRWSGNLSVDQEFALATNLTAALGASVTYIGSRKGLFTATSARAAYPDYTRVDLHGGLKRDSWALDLFVNNVTDKRASLSGGTGFFPPYSVVYIQPRTIGMSLMKTF
jgi:iron complex outermembrane recepter protein